MQEKWTNWSHGAYAVAPAAAMLTDLVFHLNGASFRPLARAPWLDDPWLDEPRTGTADDALTHLDVLGGEFPCVPFGGDHGYGANTPWQLHSEGDRVCAEIDYPADSPIRRLERRIWPSPGEPKLNFELTIEARQNGRLPLGLHPILRLPTQPAALSINADFARGYTHPSPQGRVNVTTHGAQFGDLAAVPAPDGSVDLSRLPFPSRADPSRPQEGIDDGGMLCGARSPITVQYLLENAELVLDWDDAILPSVNYWYSDRGIGEPPWDGRYRGFGIEPANAYFDYGLERSLAPNSLTAAGVTTSVELAAGTPLTIAYSLAADGADGADGGGR